MRLSPLRNQAGYALLAILTVLLAVTASSTSFIWYMNRQQAWAGRRFRALAALHVAEAGVQRALAALESVAPDGTRPGRNWRPVGYTETVDVGPLKARFTVSVESDASGTLLVTSKGQVGDVVRRVRAHISLTTPALFAALYATGGIHLGESPAALFILPYGNLGQHPWTQIAAGREVWFADTWSTINALPGPLRLSPGPLGPLTIVQNADGASPLRPAQILLAKEAALTLGPHHDRVDVQQLRVAGLRLESAVRRVDPFARPPVVDLDYYRSSAASNIANAKINKAAGRFTGDDDLEKKQDSLYQGAELARVLAYLGSLERPFPLGGVIYVDGGVTVPAWTALKITDGALVAQSAVTVEHGAVLQVTHGHATRTLPSVIVFESGGLAVWDNAQVHLHGLLYARDFVDVHKSAYVEIVGGLVANNPGVSFLSDGGTVIIRYDPAVLGTPGVTVAPEDPVIAWVISWEELSP